MTGVPVLVRRREPRAAQWRRRDRVAERRYSVDIKINRKERERINR